MTGNKCRIAIFISGRGSNLAAILNHIRTGELSQCAEPVVVVSNREDAPGLKIAEDFRVPAVAVKSKGVSRDDFEKNLLKLLLPLNIDYIVLAGFMRVLSRNFIEHFRDQIINIHPADTSIYQGAHAYEWAFENKLSETWITVHYVDEGVDTGKVIGRRRVDLTGCRTLEDVKKRGLQAEHQFYSEMLYQVFCQVFKQAMQGRH